MAATSHSASLLTRSFSRIPAPVLNGLSVGVGLATLTALIASVAGMPAAITAASGAAPTSIADTVCAPQAKAAQMLPAMISAVLVAALVALTHAHPAALTAAGLLVIFCAILWMSWGKRGGPQSFVMVLSLVFQMAAFSHTSMDLAAAGQHLMWVALGAVLMAAWSQWSIRVLAGRYRTLALTDSLEALAALMRTQASWTREQLSALPLPNAATAGLASAPEPGLRAAPALTTPDRLVSLIGQQAAIADVFQSARDLLYSQADEAPPDSTVQRQIDALIHVINLRDVVLACQLDLDRLPAHPEAAAVVHALASCMGQLADELAALAQAQRCATPPPAQTTRNTTPQAAQAVLASLGRRGQHMQTLVAQLRDTLAGALPPSDGLPDAPHQAPADASPSATPQATRIAILRSMVSPSDWTLPPLRAQLTLASPVLRYALRLTLAVACAEALARQLPWTSHPYWIWMTLAVVMRGNLEQTLARRDARIQGTLIGCLLASLLLWLAPGSPWLFLPLALALSLAHGYVLINYRVTAASGAVLALVQGHLFTPSEHPALIDAAERMADTIIGAGMAWAFSYVLPAWERRQLPQLVERLLRAQAHYAHHALHWHLALPQSARRSHARREVYDVLWLLAQSLQRMGKEPRHAREWAAPLEALLIRSHRLISHLAAIQGLLTAWHTALPADAVQAMLHKAESDIQMALSGLPAAGNAAPVDAGVPGQLDAAAADTDADADADADADGIRADGVDAELAASQAFSDTHSGQDLNTWLQRRLDQTVHEAHLLGSAARGCR